MAGAGRSPPQVSLSRGNRLILVTLGTHGQPFTRAIELVANLDTDELLIQHGSTPPRPDLVTADWVDYLASEALFASMRRADVVISHAGVGSMITAVRSGKKPVVLPRLGRFGEHVDDHQLQLAERFGQRGLVLVCTPESRVEVLVDHAKNSRPAAAPANTGGLRQSVAEAALDGLGAEGSTAGGTRRRAVRIRLGSR